MRAPATGADQSPKAQIQPFGDPVERSSGQGCLEAGSEAIFTRDPPCSDGTLRHAGGEGV